MALKTKIAGGAAALALAAGLVAAVPNEAAAQWRHHGWHHGGWRGPGVAAGVVGGLALGALAAGAGRGYYGPGYYAPAYGPDCYLTRERVWNGYTWVWRRVRMCN